jgi:Response regulator containing CheY-like receiver, AAA-type ATPase, and DNA-binding domains
LLILHINDNTDDQVLFQAAAKKAAVPIEWHVADSAGRGISYLKSLLKLSRKHEARWVDLVLLDLVLPDENGIAVLKYIRDTPELRCVPVVVLTGQMNPVMLKQAYDFGVSALHEKPAKFEDSVALVRMLYTQWSSALSPTR